MTDTPHDWRPLSNIHRVLMSPEHRLYGAFSFYEIEGVIANAVRSGEVPVRGRRFEDCYMGIPAFDRIEKRLGPTSDVDVIFDQITIHSDVRTNFETISPTKAFDLRAGTLQSRTSVTFLNNGTAGRFMDVQADWRSMEKWIVYNCIPSWWQAASRSRRVRAPMYNWILVCEETFRLMDHHGNFLAGDREWDSQARLEEKLLQFCRNKFGKEPSMASLRSRIPGWLVRWPEQKQMVEKQPVLLLSH